MVPVQRCRFKRDSPFRLISPPKMWNTGYCKLQCFVLHCAQINFDDPCEYLVQVEGSYSGPVNSVLIMSSLFEEGLYSRLVIPVCHLSSVCTSREILSLSGDECCTWKVQHRYILSLEHTWLGCLLNITLSVCYFASPGEGHERYSLKKAYVPVFKLALQWLTI